MLSIKLIGMKNHFWVYGMTQPGIETWSPVPLGEHSIHEAYN